MHSLNQIKCSFDNAIFKCVCTLYIFFGMLLSLREFVDSYLFLFCSHQIFILMFTFFIYVSYHLSRKPISVVKVCNCYNLLKAADETNCFQLATALKQCAAGSWIQARGLQSSLYS